MALGDHWISSLEGAMRVPFHMLVVLLYSAQRAFSCNLHFLGLQPLSFLFLKSYSLLYPEGRPLFLQISVTGGGAGFFWQVEPVAGFQLSHFS